MAIEQRKNKDGTQSFRARVRDPIGRWYRSEWRRIRDEAMADEADCSAKRRTGEYEPVSIEEGKRYTVDEFWAVFRLENRTETSEGWRISQDQMWRDYCSPVLGRDLLGSVGSPTIGRVLKRAAEGWDLPGGKRRPGVGPQTRLHIYRLLNQVFDSAANYYRMIKENPVNPKYHSVKVPEVESKFLHPAQSWALLEQAREEGERGVWVELLAGLRTEAMVALRWPDIHWDADQILISRAFKHKIRKIMPFPKGKKAEYVTMPPVLKEYLWECYERSPDKQGFVCPSDSGGMLPPETFGPRLKRLCKKAGVPAVSSHILRHSCTELFVQEGATQEDLRRQLNHKSGATTLRYMHRTDARLKSIAARIQKPQLKLVSGGTGECTHESTHVGTNGRMSMKESVGK